MGSSTVIEIPTWMWGMFMTVLTVALTWFGSSIRSYTQSVDGKFKTVDKRLNKHDQEIAVLKVVRPR